MRRPNIRVRAALPVLWNSIGVGLVAISGYMFIAVVQRRSGLEGVPALTQFYFLVTTVTLGVCVGLEQATSRRMAFTLATGGSVRRAIRLAGRDAVGLTAVTAAVLCLGAPVLVPRTLHGDVRLFGVLLAGLVLFAGASLLRGLLIGGRHFRAYGLTWAVDGLTRIALLTVVVIVGQPAPWVLGVTYIVPFGVGAVTALAALMHQRMGATPTTPTPAGSAADAGSGVTSLATAGLLTLAVANLPQLIYGSRVIDDAAAVAAFAQCFVLSRIVLTALAPLPAMLLPDMTRAVASHALPELRHRLRQFTLFCIGLGLAWTAIITAIGPPLAAIMFSGPTTSRQLFFLLSLSTVAIGACAPIQVALIALGRYRWVPASWATGVAAVAVLALWPTLPAATATTTGALVGPAAVMLVMTIGVHRALRAHDAAPAGSDKHPSRPPATVAGRAPATD